MKGFVRRGMVVVLTALVPGSMILMSAATILAKNVVHPGRAPDDPAIPRLGNLVSGGDERVVLPVGRDVEDGTIDPFPEEDGGHRLRALHRKGVVVLLLSDRVGVSHHADVHRGAGADRFQHFPQQRPRLLRELDRIVFEIEDEPQRRLREGREGGARDRANLPHRHHGGRPRRGSRLDRHRFPRPVEPPFDPRARDDDGSGPSLVVGKEDDDVARRRRGRLPRRRARGRQQEDREREDERSPRHAETRPRGAIAFISPRVSRRNPLDSMLPYTLSPRGSVNDRATGNNAYE